MGARSNQFLHILFGGPFRSVSLHTIWGSPSGQFICLLNGPTGHFFRLLYRGPLIQVSPLTMWGPIRSILRLLHGTPFGQFLSLLCGPHQISFFTYYMGSFRSVSSHTTWGPPQTCFFAYCMGASLRSIFFAYYMPPPGDQFLRLL